jgi:hypothetical protein
MLLALNVHVQQSTDHKLLGAPDNATIHVTLMPHIVAMRSYKEGWREKYCHPDQNTSNIKLLFVNITQVMFHIMEMDNIFQLFSMASLHA